MESCQVSDGQIGGKWSAAGFPTPGADRAGRRPAWDGLKSPSNGVGKYGGAPAQTSPELRDVAALRRRQRRGVESMAAHRRRQRRRPSIPAASQSRQRRGPSSAAALRRRLRRALETWQPTGAESAGGHPVWRRFKVCLRRTSGNAAALQRRHDFDVVQSRRTGFHDVKRRRPAWKDRV